MLDELFEIFERDNDRGDRRNRGGQRRGGIRGFFSRIFGGGDDDHDYRDEDRRYRDDNRRDDDDDDDDYGRERSGRTRRRERDFFDFGDD